MFENLRTKTKEIIKTIFTPSNEPEVFIFNNQRFRRGVSPRNYGAMVSYGSGPKWPGGMSKPGTSIDIHNHFKIRQKVRNQMYDSIEGRALVTSIVDTTVDVGLKVKPTPISEIIGRDPEELELWAENIGMRYHIWAQSKKSHRPRINNFYQSQRLYQLFQQRDNDIFTRLFYGRDKDLINPLQIDFIDPNQIRGYGYTSTYTQSPGNNDGIVRDAAGREIGYKIWMMNQKNKYEEITIPAIGEKSGRIFMLHGYNPEYAGQGRGYSKLAHAIQELENLTDFKVSHIQKAINQASFMAAVENEEQDASQPLEGRTAGPIKEYGSYPQPATDAQNITTESLEPIINWETMNEATIRQPGSVLIGNLRRGDKMKYLQDTSPSAQYDKFVESFFSSICASTGWAIELVLKKFNQNYSASRGTLLLCWRTAQIERNEMIADFCDPIYEMWLSEEIASGRVQCPGWSDIYIRAAWLNCEWSGQPMPDIDPKKSMESKKLAVELSAETLDDVARDHNGSSGKANRMKNERQFQELPEPAWGWKGGRSSGSNPDDSENNEGGNNNNG